MVTYQIEQIAIQNVLLNLVTVYASDSAFYRFIRKSGNYYTIQIFIFNRLGIALVGEGITTQFAYFNFLKCLGCAA